MKRFSCEFCGNEIHFDNGICLSCGHRIGYDPALGDLLAVEAAGPETWRVVSPAETVYRFCRNASRVGCNWLLPEGAGNGLCRACEHNRTIPDTSFAVNVERWRAIETAKRRLFYSLLRWELPVPNRSDDPAGGLAFDFLSDATGQVLTGHKDGVITLNIGEGDVAERERMRAAMGEPYRTLIGHLRHEIGHYYWDRLVRDAGRLDDCRDVFGDERADYAAALARHYEEGAPPDWAERHVSGYAASHPWEDFAETWAHLLHMTDTLETAQTYGIGGPGGAANPYDDRNIDRLVAQWVPLTIAINSVNRSMGQPDLYPFVLTEPVKTKMAFIDGLVHAG